MVTLTDWQFVQMRFEASEYRRLLTVCREQIVRQTARAERAEKTADALAWISHLERMNRPDWG